VTPESPASPAGAMTEVITVAGSPGGHSREPHSPGYRC
jgi:hypothetical protein